MVQQEIKVIYNTDSIKVRSEEGNKLLFSFPIEKYITENPDILKDAQTYPEKILVFKNDSTIVGCAWRIALHASMQFPVPHCSS